MRAFGPDAVRYYLLRAVPPFEDGDFSGGRLARLYAQDLANGIGNLVSRLTSLAERARYGRFEAPKAVDAPPGYHEAVQGYRFDSALSSLWDIVSELNREVDRARPWEDLKGGRTEPLRKHLTRWLTELHRLAHWLQPFLPATSQAILQALTQDTARARKPLFPRM